MDIAHILALIFLFFHAFIPSKLKIDNVIPVHINENPELLANHKTISSFISIKNTRECLIYSRNAARRYDDGCHVSRPLCLLHARSWLRMPMRLLHVIPQCDADDVALRAA